MLIKKNGVSINLTESDLNRITNKVLSEGVKFKGSSSTMDPAIVDLVKRIEKLEMEVLQIKKM